MRPLLLCILFLLRLPAAPPLPQGVLLERVVCEGAHHYSYSAYIPTSYRPGTAAPVFLGISPVAVGRVPVMLFQEAAERHGWILVGSNDARNGPIGPVREALNAVWQDVAARFSVDVPRSAVGGLSGGARMALDFLRSHPELRGLISMGAFGLGADGLAGLQPHAAVLLCGQEDFNHWELVEGAKALRTRGWRVWADRFPGGHDWPPAEVCGEALRFLELDAMQQGRRTQDPQLRDAFTTHRLKAAREAEGLLAKRRWEEILAEGPSVEASQALARLAKDFRMLREEVHEGRAEARMREVGHLRWKSGYEDVLNGLLAQAKGEDPVEALQAKRILGREALDHRVLWGEAVEQKQWALAEGLSRNLIALRHPDPAPWLNLACSLAGQGKREETLAALREGGARGLKPRVDPRKLPGLERLKGDDEAERLFASLGFPSRSLP